ncbi:MAG: hypothetical protein AAGF11_41805 [Myxococcota bacterium]
MSTELYKDIVPFGAPIDGATKTVTIGDWLWCPDVALSYLLGARILLDSARDDDIDRIVLPISYLQRHALEVGIKDAIDLAYEISFSRAWLGQLHVDLGAPPPTLRRASFDHGLSRLITELDRALSSIGYDPAPPLLRAMADELAETEQNKPDRWRYSKVRSQSRVGFEPSFSTPVAVPLADIQSRLETVFTRHLWFRDQEHALGDEPTLIETLGIESERLDQTLFPVLHHAGRADEI